MKIILSIVSFCVTSCTLTVAPDGSRVWKVSGEQVARAAIVLHADK